MSFLSERSSSELVGGAVLAIVAGLAVRIVMAGGFNEYFSPTGKLESAIIAAMEERPADLAMLRAVEEYFPQDYDELLEEMTDSAAAGGSAEAVGQAGNAVLMRFLDRHSRDFAFAPVAALDDVLARETAAIEALAAGDPKACAGFAENPSDPLGKLDPAAQALVGEAGAAKVRAMSAGRADQQMRLEITPDHLAELEQAMRADGASDEQVAVIFTGEGRFNLTVDAQCDAGLRLMRAIAGIADGEKRALLIGKLLAVRTEPQPA